MMGVDSTTRKSIREQSPNKADKVTLLRFLLSKMKFVQRKP
jgi:hypothetical protein